jgi:hypothetical protein
MVWVRVVQLNRAVLMYPVVIYRDALEEAGIASVAGALAENGAPDGQQVN